MIESGSDSLFRSPGFGVWQYIGDRTYATTMVMHRFSPAGDPIGSITVNANRQVYPTASRTSVSGSTRCAT